MRKSTGPLRVCIVAPSLDILGGQAVAARRLLDRLAEEPSLEMHFLPVNPRLPGPLRWLQRIKYLRTIVTSIAYVASLVIRAPRYDVLHVFSASYWSFLLAPTPAIVIGRLFGRRVVLNYHSGEAADHLTRWPIVFPLIRLAHALVVPSEYLVKVFGDFGLPAEPIYNFVDAEAYEFRRRDQPRPVLLSNRNFEAHYNVGAVLDAFRLIQENHPEASLTVAGDGSQRTALVEKAARLGVGGVTFTGPVDPAAMRTLYAAADVYVNASVVDNMPLSILEAYATGIPVVTSDAGGIPYIVADDVTGLLVPGGAPRDLAAAVERLFREEGLAARLGENARALLESRYSWPAVRQRWIECYQGGAWRT